MYTKTEIHADGLDQIIITDGIARLALHTSGLILSIDVPAEHRGEGLARQIFEYAETIMDVYHVPAWGRTEDGNAFAEAVGGDTMDDEEAAEIVGMDLSIYDVA